MSDARKLFALYENAHDALNVLNVLTANGNLRDYDDEMANRVEDAKDIILDWLVLVGPTFHGKTWKDFR